MDAAVIDAIVATSGLLVVFWLNTVQMLSLQPQARLSRLLPDGVESKTKNETGAI